MNSGIAVVFSFSLYTGSHTHSILIIITICFFQWVGKRWKFKVQIIKHKEKSPFQMSLQSLDCARLFFFCMGSKKQKCKARLETKKKVYTRYKSPPRALPAHTFRFFGPFNFLQKKSKVYTFL